MNLLQNEYVTLAILVYVIVYGLAFGLKNWLMWLYTTATNKIYIQNDLGRLLDALWLAGIAYISIYQ